MIPLHPLLHRDPFNRRQTCPHDGGSVHASLVAGSFTHKEGTVSILT